MFFLKQYREYKHTARAFGGEPLKYRHWLKWFLDELREMK